MRIFWADLLLIWLALSRLHIFSFNFIWSLAFSNFFILFLWSVLIILILIMRLRRKSKTFHHIIIRLILILMFVATLILNLSLIIFIVYLLNLKLNTYYSNPEEAAKGSNILFVVTFSIELSFLWSYWLKKSRNFLDKIKQIEKLYKSLSYLFLVRLLWLLYIKEIIIHFFLLFCINTILIKIFLFWAGWEWSKKELFWSL